MLIDPTEDSSTKPGQSQGAAAGERPVRQLACNQGAGQNSGLY